jgi:hypothetical protein
MIPLTQWQGNAHCRYSMFVLAFGLLSLGKILSSYHKQIYLRSCLIIACIGCSIMAVVECGNVWANHYQPDKAIRDFKMREYFTAQCYGSGASNGAFGLLDYLTQNDLKGLSCYVVMPDSRNTSKAHVAAQVSPLYGTRLQNRVWNLQRDKSFPPEAILFMSYLHKLDSHFPAELKVNKSDYILVISGRKGLLFLRKDFLLKPGKQERLQRILSNKAI